MTVFLERRRWTFLYQRGLIRQKLTKFARFIPHLLGLIIVCFENDEMRWPLFALFLFWRGDDQIRFVCVLDGSFLKKARCADDGVR